MKASLEDFFTAGSGVDRRRYQDGMFHRQPDAFEKLMR
jgi:hypothetical protein